MILHDGELGGWFVRLIFYVYSDSEFIGECKESERHAAREDKIYAHSTLVARRLM
jgi:hypothetical protein